MDNCLASNSETGGVGCDNMTMIVIALLRGKTKDEWYQDIADRVAKGDGPVAPPEYGTLNPAAPLEHGIPYRSKKSGADHENPAEFRGPGVRHNFEDSGDDYDLDMDSRDRGVGGRSGRIILLGDGTEVLTDGDDADTYDHEEDEKNSETETGKVHLSESDEGRAAREETPGPESQTTSAKSDSHHEQSSTDTPMTDAENNDAPAPITPKGKPIPESALPDKIVTPPTSEAKE